MSVVLKINLATRQLLNFPVRISRGGPRLLEVVFYNGTEPTLLADGATVALDLYVPDDLETPIPGSTVSSWSVDEGEATYRATLDTGRGLLGGLAYPTLYGRIRWVEPGFDVIQSDFFHVLYRAEAQEGVEQVVPWERLVNVPAYFPSQTLLPVTAETVAYGPGSAGQALERLDGTVARSFRQISPPGNFGFDYAPLIRSLIDSMAGAGGVIEIPPGIWYIKSNLSIPMHVELAPKGGVLRVVGDTVLSLFCRIRDCHYQWLLLDEGAANLNESQVPFGAPARPVWVDGRLGWDRTDSQGNVIDAADAFNIVLNRWKAVDVSGRYAIAKDVWCKQNGVHVVNTSRRHFLDGIDRAANVSFRFGRNLADWQQMSHDLTDGPQIQGLHLSSVRNYPGFDHKKATRPMLHMEGVTATTVKDLRLFGPNSDSGESYSAGLEIVGMFDSVFINTKITGFGHMSNPDIATINVRAFAHVNASGHVTRTSSNEVTFIKTHIESTCGGCVFIDGPSSTNHIKFYDLKQETSQVTLADGLYNPPIFRTRNCSSIVVDGDSYALLTAGGCRRYRYGLIEFDKSNWGGTYNMQIGFSAPSNPKGVYDQTCLFATQGELVVGHQYRIDRGDCDFTNAGADSNTIGSVFTSINDGSSSDWGASPVTALRNWGSEDPTAPGTNGWIVCPAPIGMSDGCRSFQGNIYGRERTDTLGFHSLIYCPGGLAAEGRSSMNIQYYPSITTSNLYRVWPSNSVSGGMPTPNVLRGPTTVYMGWTGSQGVTDMYGLGVTHHSITWGVQPLWDEAAPGGQQGYGFGVGLWSTNDLNRDLWMVFDRVKNRLKINKQTEIYAGRFSPLVLRNGGTPETRIALFIGTQGTLRIVENYDDSMQPLSLDAGRAL
ncbi:MAG: hypothetical protein Q7P63_01115 [Verrucomicrobiota bacterium JB022]|nr:hypothetical protein [Verrucomicrobiota bacterium JB022]